MPQKNIEPFVVKHYYQDLSPTIKGNGFDGLRVGDDREEAEEFVTWVNKALADAARYRWLRAAHYIEGGSVDIYIDGERPASGHLDAQVPVLKGSLKP